ncbi:hypothetical protein [Mesorhizobium sophorae]|uniref:hypothetical protein n=1 Tax=Mesorhizobium sophorae TaxID=1300294 RepID=UPI001FD93824|nr:hypothetical protein [Mesorhizobium sophorae]
MAAGCERVYHEKKSGKDARRPRLQAMPRRLRSGDRSAWTASSAPSFAASINISRSCALDSTTACKASMGLTFFDGIDDRRPAAVHCVTPKNDVKRLVTRSSVKKAQYRFPSAISVMILVAASLSLAFFVSAFTRSVASS